MPVAKQQLTEKQKIAMQMSILAAAKIADEHPDIADLYSKVLEIEEDIPGLFKAEPEVVAEKLDYAMWSLERIADEKNIAEEYGLSSRVAVVATNYAIHLLIPNANRRKRLKRVHHQAGALRRYSQYHNTFTAEDCSKGATNQYASMSQTERREKSLDALRAQGKTPFSDAERRKAMRYVGQKRYQIPEGKKNPGKPDMVRIAAKLNDEFHDGDPVRNNVSLSMWVNHERKKERKNIYGL